MLFKVYQKNDIASINKFILYFSTEVYIHSKNVEKSSIKTLILKRKINRLCNVYTANYQLVIDTNVKKSIDFFKQIK